MKTLLVVVFMLLASKPACAFDDWTKTNTALQVTYTVLHVIDWGQTNAAAQRGWSHTQTKQLSQFATTQVVFDENETNFILGKKPSVGTVNLYFATSLVAHAVISYTLPKVWREAWQGMGLGLEIYAVGNNYSIGLGGMF